jgi:hypothetical protein
MNINNDLLKMFQELTTSVGKNKAEYIILKIIDKNLSSASSETEKVLLKESRRFLSQSFLNKPN